METKIINGKECAEKILQNLAAEISALPTEETPIIAVIMVGDNEASQIYVRNKQKAAAKIGMGCEVMEFSSSIGENALLEVIDELNSNHHINGIIVQLPLPSHIDTLKVLSRIKSSKDVDGFGPYNSGLLSYNSAQAVISATPKGIMHLLLSTGIDLKGKNAVVIGRSNIVGKPIAMLLTNHDCTVTLAHSKTTNLPDIIKTSDIVVAACGRAKMIKGDWLKEGAVVIDVGINRIDGKLCGDIDYDSALGKASYITPVPGGVGPMTIAMLLSNTFDAFIRQQSEPECSCGKSGCHCHH